MLEDLSFKHYQEKISAAVGACSIEKLNLFCCDVISRILLFVDKADISDLYESEMNLLEILKREAKNYPVDWKVIGKSLDELTEIYEQDEEHGINIDRDITEFFAALEDWRIFVETASKEGVVEVSYHLMNILDAHFTDDESLEKWLIVPEINAEFNKQILFLQNCK